MDNKWADLVEIIPLVGGTLQWVPHHVPYPIGTQNPDELSLSHHSGVKPGADADLCDIYVSGST